MLDWREHHMRESESAVVGEGRQVGPTVSVSLRSGWTDCVDDIFLRRLRLPEKPAG